MKNKSIYYLFSFTVLLILLGAFKVDGDSENDKHLYTTIFGNYEEPPEEALFMKGLNGFTALKKKDLVQKDILSLIDFRLSANKKRLWVIDLQNKKLLFHSLVAHGRNSGNEYAKSFSNVPLSFKSSLGFYTTGKTYIGKHGLSLFLNGMEKGINDKAKERLIVMHGANYVSQRFIQKHGRLGRSYGCPSVPMKLHKEIITAIKNKSCLFIYYPDQQYESNSKLLNG